MPLPHMARLVVFLLAILVSVSLAADVTGRVVRVADGDTVTVLDAGQVQHKIRLAGIDAPEKKQAYGEKSRESLEELVAGRTVVVEFTKRDRYGRRVGRLLLDRLDVNLMQISRGMAWHYKAYAREQRASDQRAYAEAETEARRARIGLWRDDEPTPPWDFRHEANR